MKYTKSILMGTGSFLLAGLTLTLLAPKAAHAVVATLVQVANTTSSPVNNLDAESNSRIPYQSSVILRSSCGSGVPTGCLFNLTAVPAGYRLVVQNVSVVLVVSPGSTPPLGILENGDGLAMGLAAGAVGPNLGGNSYAGFNQAVTAYFDAGSQPSVFVVANFINDFQYATVTGYLQNCTLSACPAIQN